MSLAEFAETVAGPLRPWQRRILDAFERDPWRGFSPRPPLIIRTHLRPEDLLGRPEGETQP